jgi:hypothetical protein
MSLPGGAQSGAEVMAQFIPARSLGGKLGIVAEVLDGDEVRLRMPFDPTNGGRQSDRHLQSGLSQSPGVMTARPWILPSCNR